MPAVLGASLVGACGSKDLDAVVDPPASTPGGQDVDGGAVDGAAEGGASTIPGPCAGVDCGPGGTCAVVDGRSPICACAQGYEVPSGAGTEGFVSSGKIQRRPRAGGAAETFATPAYLSNVIGDKVYFTKTADGPLLAKAEAGGAERTVVPAGGGQIGLVRKLGECLIVSKENNGIDNDPILIVTP